jgi:hypothetical protein
MLNGMTSWALLQVLPRQILSWKLKNQLSTVATHPFHRGVIWCGVTYLMQSNETAWAPAVNASSRISSCFTRSPPCPRRRAELRHNPLPQCQLESASHWLIDRMLRGIRLVHERPLLKDDSVRIACHTLLMQLRHRMNITALGRSTEPWYGLSFGVYLSLMQLCSRHDSALPRFAWICQLFRGRPSLDTNPFLNATPPLDGWRQLQVALLCINFPALSRQDIGRIFLRRNSLAAWISRHSETIPFIPFASVSRRSGITLAVVYPDSSDQCNFATDVILPCHVLDFPGIQERILMQTPPSSQLRHWMNHASRGTGPALHEFPSYTGQAKVVSSFPA